MPNLSLTDLIDVVSKSGSPKATKVKQIKNRPAYQPAIDFYKSLRDSIIAIHTTGKPRTAMDAIVPKLTDVKKITSYPDLIQGYKKWWGKQNFGWFVPPRCAYSHAGIDINVNPELGLVVNGTRVIIKLYLKSDSISQFRIDLIPLLMELVLRPSCQPGDIVALLDVRKGKLHYLTVNPVTAKPVLDAELAYVAALWPHV